MLLILFLIFHATIINGEVFCIGHSHSQACNDLCNTALSNHLTLSQFVSNSSKYVTNDTKLIFAPGNYDLQSALIIENINSFSMYGLMEPISSSKPVIVCSYKGRFEFKNAGSVAIIGLDFIQCLKNRIASVNHFQLENSMFYTQELNNGTVLIIDGTKASLERVVFTSSHQSYVYSSPEYHHTTYSDVFDNNRVLLSRKSIITIKQGLFKGYDVGLGGVIFDEFQSDITITDCTFLNNRAATYDCSLSNCSAIGGIVHTNGLWGRRGNIKICAAKFEQNFGAIVVATLGSTVIITDTNINDNTALVYATDSDINISRSTLTNNNGMEYLGSIVITSHTKLNIYQCTFIANSADFSILSTYDETMIDIDESKFIKNSSPGFPFLNTLNTNVSIKNSEFVSNDGQIWCSVNLGNNMIIIEHSEFLNYGWIEGTLEAVVWLDGYDTITMKHNKFSNNTVNDVVKIEYYVRPDNITDNVFVDNDADYQLFISSNCRPGLSLSLGSPRCIKCTGQWHRDLLGITIAGFIAGIALVVFMLAFNITVAVGTLNGILFFANIVAANDDTYFWQFTSPNMVTVFISWLNFDIGFDACLSVSQSDEEISNPAVYKTLIQLAFPVYMILLVIIVIIASECSSSFAKLTGKGNPVAVLATMILLSYAKFFNAIFSTVTFLYSKPAYGSHDVDAVSVFQHGLQSNFGSTDVEYVALRYFALVVSIIIFLLAMVFTILVFAWQWLLKHQDRPCLKCAKSQKMCHFMEPYHAPLTAKYRYWTGLLLLVRVLLSSIRVLNFSLDPRVNMISIIFVVGGLILIKGIIAKRIYTDQLLDVIEVSIHFNLVALSAFTWYNLDAGRIPSQTTAVYVSIMIIIILFLGVIIFHILRYTVLYKCSFVKRAFNWLSSKLNDEQQMQDAPIDAPEELDGYQFERPEEEQPFVTRTVVELPQQPGQQSEDGPQACQQSQDGTAY